ncbi:bifunctional protein-serine/threonine kinase/phosphatase [Gilvimarinus sp. SDUM040013]|uniref:Bifunctional protein-serine/threonine kinase/phosphatase n=1 Tax=Gilvimarinus gilvus TaxID=3058038 RepID=A0ABU4RZG6_9GAMM|nr:bifunctional protein-serine/threonine kinase/phosphatase [Gilvimarinus sp. SDUM040013]MDO3387545.1 bifunctional protein-serine/threonine kinase/phosphatase [Gilvimarinus sp. SDUM040013]MDX6850190.1 bifunctional protein-serine/threonine kinase/phosphatase [Gilvimarinus sp. SDUM040013]
MEHLQPSLSVSFAQLSEAGRKSENQDTVGACFPEGAALATKGIAVAIADGVSSSQSAKQASQTAITGFLNDYYATPDTWRTGQSANRVIQSLNRYLWSQGQNSVRQEGFLTTLSLLIFKGDKMFVFHVGDSRIYRYRQGSLEQITRDHNQRIDHKTTYLSRAMGADLSLEVDMQSHEIERGDIYLLSTDGLHDFIDHRSLTSHIEKTTDLEELTQQLYSKALANGSEDNISVQIARVDDVGTPSESDAITVLSRLPFPPILDVGQTLDGLTVEKILHESERSQVYLVKRDDDTRLVMKTPSPNYVDDAAFIERFVRESWIGSRLNNRQVVRVVEPKQTRSCLYYLTEYIPGPTLTQLINERAPFAVADATELAEQLVTGVRALHRRDTLHQDLKPDNIVMGRQGACLIDFGSCWVAGIEEMASPIAGDKILGTLDYSAPEYRYGGPTGPRSDQFSLAVLVYEMLTGKHPYGDGYGKAMSLAQFQKLTYRSALQFNPLVPVWMDRALEKSLYIQPAQRYEALSEWLRDIKRPNPNWLTAKHKPLIERHPERVWKVLAIAGWAVAIGLLVFVATR